LSIYEALKRLSANAYNSLYSSIVVSQENPRRMHIMIRLGRLSGS